jgi:uncharacterized protein YaeQ
MTQKAAATTAAHSGNLRAGKRWVLALTATIYKFDIDLADADRQVYETLALQVARHPSESEEFLVTRVLAFALEFTEGIAFSRGLSDPDEPAIVVRDLTGGMLAWIDVGTPDASRLHKACKSAPRVAVYMHKDPSQFLARLAGERIHRAETVALYAIDRALVAALCARLDRRMDFALSVAGSEVTVSLENDTLTGAVVRYRIP